MNVKPLPTIISRVEAHQQGRTRFYTGIPCKQGHIAERYVSTAGCVDCLSSFKLRRHPTRKDLVPYVCPKLWVPTGTTPEQYQALEKYLDACITAFFEHEKLKPCT